MSFGENMFCSNVVPPLLWSGSARIQLQKDTVYYRNVHGGHMTMGVVVLCTRQGLRVLIGCWGIC